MKMYSKKELKMKDGYIISPEGDVLSIDPRIVNLANDLETELQQAHYLHKQPKGQPLPSLEGFRRKSDRSIEIFVCDTPIADKNAAETMAFMDELDNIELADKMNNHLLKMTELIMFVQCDDVFDGHYTELIRFDTPELGSPLTWTEETIDNAVAEIHGCKAVENNEFSKQD